MRGKILIVDDHAANRRFLRRKLETMGYEAAEAGDGGGIVDVIQKERPSVVLLDIGLPRSQGAGVLRAITQFDPTLPVILTADEADEKERSLALEGGARGFIAKPHRLADVELSARINLALFRQDTPRKS